MKNKALTGYVTGFSLVVTLGSLLLSGCAGLIKKDVQGVAVAKTERMYFVMAPFDSVVTAELVRSGVDPAEVEKELDAEIRYNVFLQGQEEALDSAGAGVVVMFTVHHLQPGMGNAGTYASYSLQGQRSGRKSASESAAWTWQSRAKDNVPTEFFARHVARQAAREVVSRLRVKKVTEPAPPLHLMR